MTRRQINPEELNVLYELIGKAIWHLQHVEDALATYITVKRDIKTRGGKPATEAESILAKHRTSTLGTALRASREAEVLSQSLQERLEKFKNERDWLVHRSLHQNGKDLYEDEKRYPLMQRVDEFSKEALALQRAIAAELEEFVVSQGADRQWIEAYAQQQLRNLRDA